MEEEKEQSDIYQVVLDTGQKDPFIFKIYVPKGVQVGSIDNCLFIDDNQIDFEGQVIDITKID